MNVYFQIPWFFRIFQDFPGLYKPCGVNILNLSDFVGKRGVNCAIVGTHSVEAVVLAPAHVTPADQPVTYTQRLIRNALIMCNKLSNIRSRCFNEIYKMIPQFMNFDDKFQYLIGFTDISIYKPNKPAFTQQTHVTYTQVNQSYRPHTTNY